MEIALLLPLLVAIFLIGAFYYLRRAATNSKSAGTEIPGYTMDVTFMFGPVGGLMPFLHKIHEKYGLVAQFFMGKMHVVSFMDNDLVHEVLQRCSTRNYEIHRFLFSLVGDDNLQVYDAERARLFRKAIVKFFADVTLKQVYEQMKENCFHIVHDLEISKPVIIDEHMLKFTLNGAVQMIGGTDKFFHEIDLVKFRKCYDVLVNATFDRQFGALPADVETQIPEAKEMLAKAIDILLSPEGSNPKSFLEFLRSGIDPTTGEVFTRKMMESHVAVNFIAAYHNSAFSLIWAMYFLSHAPQYADKMAAEVTRVSNGEGLQGLDSLAKLNELRYTECVMKETIRVSAVGPLASRIIEEETMQFGPYVLKKDDVVFVPLIEMMHNKNIWKEPSKFNPDRFEEETQEMRDAFLPFGLGARNCYGEKMARTEMKLMMAAMCYYYHILPNTEGIKPLSRFVTIPSKPISVILKPR